MSKDYTQAEVFKPEMVKFFTIVVEPLENSDGPTLFGSFFSLERARKEREKLQRGLGTQWSVYIEAVYKTTALYRIKALLGIG